MGRLMGRVGVATLSILWMVAASAAEALATPTGAPAGAETAAPPPAAPQKQKKSAKAGPLETLPVPAGVTLIDGTQDPFAVISTDPSAPASVLSVDKVVRRAGAWSIGFSKAMGGCLAAATYQDHTTLWFGFSTKEDDGYLAFTNPGWAVLEPRKRYELTLAAEELGEWRGRFQAIQRGSHKGLVIDNLHDRFVLALSQAKVLEAKAKSKLVVKLSLAGIKPAMDALADCQVSYLEGKDPGAKAAQPNPGSSPKHTGSGSGFFVSSAGHVITNHHVVEGCRALKVVPLGAAPVSATLAADDATNDLALLRTDLKPPVVPALATRARVGDKVYAYGFPLSGVLATGGNFTDGMVTALAGRSDDTREIQVSAPVQPGNSGGPALDQNGNVVGILTATLANASRKGDQPQNVNFAVKASMAASFLDANGLSTDEAPRTKAMEPAAIAELARRFTVLVLCE